MQHRNETKKKPIGKALRKLHKWNAWLVVILAVSGILLSIGVMRGYLGEGRVWLKQLHIWLGVASTIVFVLYLPLLRQHLKQLKGRRGQLWNLGIVIFIIVGWIVSGIVLWMYRHLPPQWSNSALIFHDLLTWIGIPYAVYHSITRMRWMRRGFTHAVPMEATSNAGADLETKRMDLEDEEGSKVVMKRPPITGKPFYTRRQFMKSSIGFGLAVITMPFFFRWLAASFGPQTQLEELYRQDLNRMLPQPKPLPESEAVIGGGSQGNFRVYTITDIPSFSSNDWTFKISGHVERPITLDWKSFLDLKRKVQVSDFHCITGWSVYNNTWEGIPLSALLREVGVQPNGKFVKFVSGDGVYTDSLSLEQAMEDDVMLAMLHDGKPIPNQLGGPVRLVVPRMYAYKSVKWVQEIELVENLHVGYWQQYGYDINAWIKKS